MDHLSPLLSPHRTHPSLARSLPRPPLRLPCHVTPQLGLLTHEPHCMLIREVVDFTFKRTPKDKLAKPGVRHARVCVVSRDMPALVCSCTCAFGM